MTTNNTTEDLRQFKTVEEIIAALSVPGTKFYTVLWKNSRISEYTSYGIKTSTMGFVYVATREDDDPEELAGLYREYVEDSQNNPNKGLFTDRALAEKFWNACQTWDEDPSNAYKRDDWDDWEYDLDYDER